MVYKKAVSGIEEDQPSLPDEGWWASVLADEEIFTSKEGQTRNESLNNQEVIDWDRIQKLFEDDEIVSLRVQNFNRGGLLVEGDGLQGFVPISHLIDAPQGIDEDQKQSFLSRYVSQVLRLKVIECEPAQERVVFSERAALAGQGRRKYLFNSLKPGDVIEGTVTNITDFGVFVDLGGLEGLIHVSELSWGRVQHPSDIVEIEQEINAQVLQISEESSRVALSLKRLVPNPWETLTSKYAPGDIVHAEVTGIARFGIFARLDEGVEGLIHISSISLPSPYSTLSDEFYPGQSVTVRILQIDVQKRRLGLNLVSYE